jgi:hypothetical protein
MARQILTWFSQSMHYDFCPWANSYIYWLKRPIGWVGLALSASILLGICVSHQAFLATAAIAALGVTGCVWPCISTLGMKGTLGWSQLRCEEGDTIVTTMSILHRWPWPAWGMTVEADDAIASHVDAENQPICLSRVPALSKSDFEWTCRPRSRGRYPQKTVLLSTAFPFGIWKSHRKVTVRQSLIVWPKVVKLIDVPQHHGHQNNGIGSVSEKLGDEGDWMGVRPYRPGDSLRQVHWAQTSRRDSLVVFDRQTRCRQVVSLWLDSTAATSANYEEREWMIRILATLGTHFLAHSWRVLVQSHDAWTFLQSNECSKQSWMDQLATWQPGTSCDLGNDRPNVRDGLCYCISNTSRATQLTRTMASREALRCSWFLVQSNEQEQSESPFPNQEFAIKVNPSNQPAENLKIQWQRMCQRASRSKVGILS